MLTNQLIVLTAMIVILVVLLSSNPVKIAEVKSKVRK